jgi:hypothetical protein
MFSKKCRDGQISKFFYGCSEGEDFGDWHQGKKIAENCSKLSGGKSRKMG